MRAKMIDAVVVSWAVSFLFVYKCMAMLNHAKIAAIWTAMLIMAKFDVDVRNSVDWIKNDERLDGKYICSSASWLHGKIVEAKFNSAAITSV